LVLPEFRYRDKEFKDVLGLELTKHFDKWWVRLDTLPPITRMDIGTVNQININPDVKVKRINVLKDDILISLGEVTSCKIKEEKWVDGEYYAKLICGKEEKLEKVI